MNVYKPYNKESKVARLIESARKRNHNMSQVEHNNGFAAPEDGPLDEGLRTVLCALVAGVELWDTNRNGSLECITEGIALLQDVEARLHVGYVRLVRTDTKEQ